MPAHHDDYSDIRLRKISDRVQVCFIFLSAVSLCFAMLSEPPASLLNISIVDALFLVSIDEISTASQTQVAFARIMAVSNATISMAISLCFYLYCLIHFRSTISQKGVGFLFLSFLLLLFVPFGEMLWLHLLDDSVRYHTKFLVSSIYLSLMPGLILARGIIYLHPSDAFSNDLPG